MTFRAKKLYLKSLALSGLFGAKWFCPNCTTGVFFVFYTGKLFCLNEFSSFQTFYMVTINWCNVIFSFNWRFIRRIYSARVKMNILFSLFQAFSFLNLYLSYLSHIFIGRIKFHWNKYRRSYLFKVHLLLFPCYWIISASGAFIQIHMIWPINDS